MIYTQSNSVAEDIIMYYNTSYVLERILYLILLMIKKLKFENNNKLRLINTKKNAHKITS